MTLPRTTVSVLSRRIRARALVVVVGGGGGGDGGAANRAIGVTGEPHIDARGVERVLALAQLPDLLPVGERRQAHRALTADLRRILPVLHIGDVVGAGGNFDVVAAGGVRRDGGLAGKFAGGRSRVSGRRAPEGEDEGVD